MTARDLSPFATTPYEQEIEEAVRAVQRVLVNPLILNSTRVALEIALDALRHDQACDHPSRRRGAAA